MKLRKLELRDAPLMLEWMHDESVVKNLQAKFAAKTIKDCENFIITFLTDQSNLHLAIVDDDDAYMGTVSLKNIADSAAEFAITIRKSAMGKGYSKYAMEEIIRIGLEELNLVKIYWYVSPENKRAIRFYDKNGYQRVDVSSIGNGWGSTATHRSRIIYVISASTEIRGKMRDCKLIPGYCVERETEDLSSWKKYRIKKFSRDNSL